MTASGRTRAIHQPLNSLGHLTGKNPIQAGGTAVVTQSCDREDQVAKSF